MIEKTNEIDSNTPKTLEERIESAYKSKNGLYPHEILVLAYADGFKTATRKTSRIWETKYQIYDVPTILRSLRERGFLTIGDITRTLQNQPRENLRTLLDKKHLYESGSQEEMVRRVLNYIPKHKLEKYFPERYYELTELGKEEVGENYYIIEAANFPYGGMDIWLANQREHTTTDQSLADISWDVVSKKTQTNLNPIFPGKIISEVDEKHQAESFDQAIDPKTVYLFKQKLVSHYRSSNYEMVTAHILCANKNTLVPVTVYYQKSSGQYFMNEETYQTIRNTYGLPFLKLKPAFSLSDSSNRYSTYRENSELNLFGYSVSETTGLSRLERQELLGQLIDSKLMRKSDIVNHIEWLIHTRKHLSNMGNAVREWESDLRFVNEYKMDQQRSIFAKLDVK